MSCRKCVENFKKLLEKFGNYDGYKYQENAAVENESTTF